MTYALGANSLAHLAGVDPKLAETVKLAITITDQDFAVNEGLRSFAQQLRNVKKGVSKTLKSKHLDGRAVDLVPWHGGALRWEWPLIYPIALAMRKASYHTGAKLRWGGAWDRQLEDLPGDVEGLKRAVAEYSKRHPGPDLLDGPHFELPA